MLGNLLALKQPYFLVYSDLTVVVSTKNSSDTGIERGEKMSNPQPDHLLPNGPISAFLR
jgi:hypothetical protein